MISSDSHKPLLVSLYDMLVKYAFLYCSMEKEIADLEAWLRDNRRKNPDANDKVIVKTPSSDTGFVYILKILKNETIGVKLPSVRAQIARIEEKISKEMWDLDDMIAHVKELRNRLQDDLESQNFLYVPDDMALFYESAGVLFGETVIQRFPGIIDDAEGAGHCLALGEGTACVLHLMRVMEVGLKALSTSLGIPYAPSWESHLGQIETKISEKYAQKTDEWKKHESFYRDVSGDLMTVKQAWRNPTMHVGRKYGGDEAKEIFNAVRSFMKRLAEGIPASSSSVLQFPSASA